MPHEPAILTRVAVNQSNRSSTGSGSELGTVRGRLTTMRSLIAIVLLTAVVSSAQTPTPPAKAPKPQTLDFADGLEVDGTTQQPLVGIYFVPPARKFSNLIKVRMNFNDKLLASVNEL